jgi:hypothetical protein
MSETNGFVTIDQWLAPDQRTFIEVDVEGFGRVRIRSLNEEERTAIEAPNFTKKGELNLEKSRDTKLRAIAAAVVNANGDPIMGNIHVQQLRKKDSRLISTVYNAIAKHCGLDSDTREATEKNSETTFAGSSPSS